MDKHPEHNFVIKGPLKPKKEFSSFLSQQEYAALDAKTLEIEQLIAQDELRKAAIAKAFGVSAPIATSSPIATQVPQGSGAGTEIHEPPFIFKWNVEDTALNEKEIQPINEKADESERATNAASPHQRMSPVAASAASRTDPNIGKCHTGPEFGEWRCGGRRRLVGFERSGRDDGPQTRRSRVTRVGKAVRDGRRVSHVRKPSCGVSPKSEVRRERGGLRRFGDRNETVQGGGRIIKVIGETP